jgi:isoleucyl-tRNA synthetase
MNKEENKKGASNPFPQMEEDVLEFWERGKTFQKSLDKEAPHGDYVFYDGPPFATGLPHYGHLVASIMKDAVPRYWTMRGYRVERRWGWDCHGLPVENLAEKEMELSDKTEIEKKGVDCFNDYCQGIVMRYANEWKGTIKRIGRWVDVENDYKTMDADYMESIWWVFKTLWDKGLIYKGYKSMHICPRCGTTLSNFEVAQGYKDIKDLSAIAKFELVDEPGTFVLAWTTTPWTLIGNVALAVGEEIEYVKSKSQNDNLKLENEIFIIAKERIDEILKDCEYEIVEEFKGEKIIGLKYKPLFDYYSKDEKLENLENGWKIYGAGFVSTEEGTGVVHIAPAFGDDDLKLGQENNLPFIQHVDMDGRLVPAVTDFAGLEVKPKPSSAEAMAGKDDHMKTDIEIIKYLAHKNLLFHKEKYEHSYPHCWRCDSPLLNYATDSFFVQVTKIKDDLIANNQKVHWVPEHIRDGRFGKWIEQARDWAISRNRYWGAPLPVWNCADCGNTVVVGSREELEKLSGQKLENLHKQFVDKISWSCECGDEMRRVPEVLDCWFESGSMPYAQEHYPFENKEKFEKNFPADFIAEGVDQTRGWFYTMMVLATALFGREAAKNIIVNGIVLAEDGQKMSKRLNNYPDPTGLFDTYSVDSLRYYLLSSPVLVAENLNFSEDGVKEVLRKVQITLWNVVKFYELFGDTSPQPSPSKGEGENNGHESENVLDRWILARLNELLMEVTDNMDRYDLPRAVRPIEGFVNDLSTWYIRRSRDRFKSSSASTFAKATADKEASEDKVHALHTTRFVLIELAKIIAPFMPFLAEQIWQRLSGFNFEDENRSVHLENWSSFAKAMEDKPESGKIIEEMEVVRKIVEMGLAKRDEAGIKVRQPLQKLEVRSKKLELDNQYIELIRDEVNVKEILFEKIEGDMGVELDLNITPELKQEGVKREIVRFVNGLRKDAGLSIGDAVDLVVVTESENIKAVLEKFQSKILKETLSQSLFDKEIAEMISKNVKIENEQVLIGIVKK